MGEVPLSDRINARRVARVVIVAVLAVASSYYLATSLHDGWRQVRNTSWLEHPWLLVAGIAVNAAALSAGCWTWWKVLARLSDGGPRFFALWRLWAISNPARYLPGRIWHVAALGMLAPSAGVERAPLVTSMLVQMWFVLLANLILAVGALRSANDALWLALPAGIVMVVAVGTSPGLLNAVLRLSSRVARKPVLEWTGSWGVGAAMVLSNLAAIVVAGAGACLVIRGTMGLPTNEFPRLIAAQAAAFIAGYLSLVPAGLGVREAALTLLLAPAFTPGWAATVAVILRLSNTVTELLLLGGAMPLTRQVHS